MRWMSARATCTACAFVGWVIKHEHAEVVCPQCGSPTRAAQNDEYKARLYGRRAVEDERAGSVTAPEAINDSARSKSPSQSTLKPS